MNYKIYKIPLQNNIQNENEVHFLTNVLYASNSIVHKLLVFQILFQITFIRRKILIKPPLFQATIVIFFYTKMKDFMQGASKLTGKRP